MSIFYTASLVIFCYCSVAQLCLTLCDPMDCSTPGFPVLHYPWSLLKLTSIESRMPSNLCCPHLLLPSIFSSIRVFSSELAVCTRWPKYWSFNFSISPSNEYSGLISWRIIGNLTETLLGNCRQRTLGGFGTIRLTIIKESNGKILK